MNPTGHNRAQPSPTTKRQLYLLSGNCCAFPGCKARIIDELGNYVAHICHIEAAMPGGERYNADMTNDERAHADNLMLMCYPHHVQTNDVDAFPRELLHSYKQQHEDRYRAGLQQLVDVADLTRQQSYTPPGQMKAFLDFEAIPADLTPEELEDTRADVRTLIDQLRVLSRPARQVLSIVIDRGEHSPVGRNDDLQMLYSELGDVVGLGTDRVRELVQQLEKREFVVVDDDFDGIYHVITHRPRACNEWPTWTAFKKFCGARGLHVEALLVELRFDFLN